MYSNLINFLIKIYLKFKGSKIGKNFTCANIPIIDANLNKINLEFGDNVKIGKNVEFFFRNVGKIIISNEVKIDNNVRLLVANKATLKINSGTRVGKNSVINAGDDIMIGEKCLISGNCYIQSSSHSFDKSKNIMDQNYKHEKIVIENDVWIGANSIVLKGVKLKKGSIIGSLTKVESDTEEYSIYSGNPMSLIKKREKL